MKTILTTDWAPHAEAIARRLAQVCTVVYVAGYITGAWLHHLNDQLAGRASTSTSTSTSTGHHSAPGRGGHSHQHRPAGADSRQRPDAEGHPPGAGRGPEPAAGRIDLWRVPHVAAEGAEELRRPARPEP